jgi:NTP pyrophosphatase (non-canonical NTP hydrolase)
VREKVQRLQMRQGVRAGRDGGRVMGYPKMYDDEQFYKLKEANEARQREWDEDNQISLSYRGNEFGGECGELQNVLKKLDREAMGIKGSRATLVDAANEMADVVICLDLIATHLGIDLWEAVKTKFNATSEKHGLKTRLGA